MCGPTPHTWAPHDGAGSVGDCLFRHCGMHWLAERARAEVFPACMRLLLAGCTCTWWIVPAPVLWQCFLRAKSVGAAGTGRAVTTFAFVWSIMSPAVTGTSSEACGQGVGHIVHANCRLTRPASLSSSRERSRLSHYVLTAYTLQLELLVYIATSCQLSTLRPYS